MNEADRKSRLSAADKASLLKHYSAPRSPQTAAAQPPRAKAAAVDDYADLEHYREIELVRSAGKLLGIEDPFFRVHDETAGAETVIGGRRYMNFSSYNYLGLNGDPRVSAAAKAAIDRYGTSASASRIVSGERAVHRDLERALAEILGVEDCVTFVSGHATNVGVIGHLMSEGDLILHDELIHNSVIQGALLARARRISFPHGDVSAVVRLLAENRARYRRVLVVIEGHYSMEGDIPDLPAFVETTRRHRAWLMVDEAHSLGVLGPHGFGLADHFGVEAGSTIWMGTLSKTLAGCGGYIGGPRKLIEYLKFSAPGFVYSVGMPPPIAAAALAALEILRREPERVRRLNANARLFLESAKAANLNTGISSGFGIVPIITGSSIIAGRLSDALYRRGINVQPIFYPAVPERMARLRFFLSSEHTEDQLRGAVAAVTEEHAAIIARKLDLPALAVRLALQRKNGA